MAVVDVLLLGNPKLHEVSSPVKKHDVPNLKELIKDLHDTLMDFKRRTHAGRAIAAPQVGVMKRIIYIYVDRPVIFLNPIWSWKSRERMVVWDDCMCFPDLLVKVKRHRTGRISYRDTNWNRCEISLEEDLSELLQHEVDHLDGILAVSRAIDQHSFALRSQKRFLRPPQPWKAPRRYKGRASRQ